MTTTADGGHPRRRWPIRLAIGAALLVVGLAAALGARFGFDTDTVDSPLIGQPAPQHTLPQLEDEGDVEIPDDFAGEVLVVNFWASWCVPCRAEHPALLQVAASYRDRGVTLLGVVFQDTEQGAIGFLDELGRGYVHVTDPESRAAVDFGVFGIPETFVIDRDGVIVAKIVGQLDYPLLASTLDDVLSGEEPGSVSGGGETWSEPGGP